ncbi:MAG: ornithine cyclodeaminase family protein [Gemmatimonadales bacterium]|jgi:ornithine cyclodeaminase/alanine dehydrogenase-like protein (mu-crystallin family)
MRDILILDHDDVVRLLEVDPLIEKLEEAFAAFSEGRASVPPRIAARTPHGWLGAMPGWVEGMGLATKLVSVFPGNAGGPHPSHQGIIAFFDDETGTPIALLDAERITALRTAAASAVAARLLARPDARVLAVLGAGVQGRAHVEALPRVLELDEIRIASRSRDHVRALADDASALMAVAGREPPRVTLAETFEAAVRGADVVACCTDAAEPILDDDWLAAGMHVGSVGAAAGRELPEATIHRGRLFVEWRGAATEPPPAGAGELQGVDPETVTELGEVLAGCRPGRTSDEELTVYKSTGHAVEDVAAARLVVDRALSNGK